MVALCLCLLYLILVFFSHQSNPMEFIRPAMDEPKGYDGQFTYAIALDPLNAAPQIDVPAYRYQRILHPILARIVALGQPGLIVWAILLVNLVAYAAGVAALERLLIDERISRWYALVYALFGGMFFAVRVSTAEPLAYGLALLAILAERRGRLVWMAILLALAAPAKETTLFFIAGYLLYFALERRWREVLRLGIIAVVPFALWQIVLKLWLGQFGVGSGGADATPFQIIPYNGIWSIAANGIRVFLLLGVLPLIMVGLPSLWALWRTIRDTIQHRWHPYVFLLLANAAIMPFVPESTYREPLGIARFAVGLVIGVLLYAALRRNRRVLLYSTIWPIFGILLLG